MAENKTKIIIETESGNSEQKLRNIANGLKNISKESKATGYQVGQSTSQMMSNFVALGAKVAAVVAVMNKAYTSAKEAASFKEIALYTKSATESIGLSFERMAEASRRGASGMADSVTIMRANLKALKGGLNATEDEIGKLWEIANATGDELGSSIEHTFEQITNAISTGNGKALIQMGVLPENFARSSNSAQLLSNRAELLKTVLDQLGRSTDRLNGLGDTSYDKFQRLENAFKDLKTQATEGLVPALTPVVEVLTEIVKGATKATEGLSKLMGVKEISNPFLAYSKDELLKLQNQKRNNIYQYKDNADIVRTVRQTVGWSGGISYENGSRWSRSQLDNAFGSNRYNWENMAKAEEASLLKVGEALDHINALEKKRKELTEQTNQKNAETAFKLQDQKQQLDSIFGVLTGVRINQDEINKKIEEESRLAKERAREGERLVKQYGNLAESIMPEFHGTEREAYDLMVKISAAAGGIGTAFMKSDKELEAFNKSLNETLDKLNTSVSNSFIADTLEGKFQSKNYGDMVKTVFGGMTQFGAFNGLGEIVAGTKEKNTTETIKKGYVSVRKMLHEDLSEAVVSGITNSNIGEALRGMVSSIASAKANSYGSTLLGGLFGGKGFSGLGGAVSGFVGSIAISAIANNWKKWFGDKNKSETMASNAATIERGSNAYLQTYAAMLNPFMTNSMYYDLLDARYNSYGNMTVSWKSKSRGGLAGVFGGKNYSDTTPQKTFDVIQAMEDAVEAIKDYNTKEEKRLDLLSAQGYGYSVLSQQVSALSDAVDRANWMSDSYSINWSGGEHFEIDLSDNIQDLKKAYYEALREYGSETANRSNTASSTFLSLFPYLNSYSWYGMRDVGWGYTDISNPLSALNYVTNASNMFADRNANRQLFDIVSSAGYNQFSLQSLQYSDPTAYAVKYLEILEKSRDAAALVMAKQEEIYFDATKTFEEQSAALEMYQQAQEQYYNTKLEIMAQERAKEEQIKREQQQANLRASEKMEALLGFSGELSRTNNKIYILEGADQQGALKELLGAVKDDPEAVAAVQAMLTAANNKNKFGKF